MRELKLKFANVEDGKWAREQYSSEYVECHRRRCMVLVRVREHMWRNGFAKREYCINFSLNSARNIIFNLPSRAACGDTFTRHRQKKTLRVYAVRLSYPFSCAYFVYFCHYVVLTRCLSTRSTPLIDYFCAVHLVARLFAIKTPKAH